VHYVEGCTAPIYSSDSLHSAVVEIVVKKGARCRYTTIQNWSNNVYNLVTKRAVAPAGPTMEGVERNIGPGNQLKEGRGCVVQGNGARRSKNLGGLIDGHHLDAMAPEQVGQGGTNRTQTDNDHLNVRRGRLHGTHFVV